MSAVLYFLTMAMVTFSDAYPASSLPYGYTKRSVKLCDPPLNGLPSPVQLRFKYVALGLGTQNYTCANTSSSPVATGAVATLYDATSLLSNAPEVIPVLPPLAYSTSSSLGLPTLGHHFFSASSVPTFDLQAANPPAFLSAKKVASVNAPSASVPNSVAWLYLADDGRGVSKDLKAVYRVETASGSPPETCTKVGPIEVKYSAEYWFYE
ncbi:hypothetical protein AAFC00_000808 [Neodothiora populina]|uniref:Malate dehydrogenase n=1 Tax=Neodothiora populina TaxID=2781224 RepID=A0ABR3PMV5_9PEZI